MNKPYDNHGAYLEEIANESGKVNLLTLLAVSIGVATFATGATLLKIGCNRYLPQICDYIKYGLK